MSELEYVLADFDGDFIRHSDGGVSERSVGVGCVLLHFIRHSDGGVSEHESLGRRIVRRFYQAFRWWGVGTLILSSEHSAVFYQAFRWWRN